MNDKYKKEIIRTCISVVVAARSEAWVYGRSLAGIVGSNPAGGMGISLC
jgi:hypothetical protein